MKRILINATQNEEIRVALCKGNHLYDFDLENRTREQKKSNIYKGHVTRVEPSLEAVFVEYGSQRQGFLPIREISTEYLSGNPRDENIKKLIKEGDELIVQVEKEERGNKGAALSTYVSLAGRYLVLMPNNPRGGGISRQISGKLREDMKRMLSNLDLPKGMSVIIRTAGIGKTQEDLQHDLNHLLNIWQAIQEQNKKYPSPRLVHQEAGVVTRAVRDYLRDDISEIWIDNENAYIEAAGFIDAVMPTQAEKLRKYTDYEPMFSRFNIEKQIETAYQREVRLPSGGSIVIDQTEALVSIDINSAKSTKGSDVAETAYHTNLEAADEIARQLRLRDMGGLIVIDFIDMNDNKNQKEVEKRLIDATKYDRARVQFGDISKFGLMEMSRQRLRPSLEESTGYICPRCHGNGMIRDLRSLSLSIMRQIEQIALKERQGEVQAEVPTDIAAFLLNEKRDSLVYLEQDSGTRITILPHAHLESPNFKLHFNRDGFAPSSYERITDTQQQEYSDLGYDVDWQTAEKERPEQQPTRQPRASSTKQDSQSNSHSNHEPSGGQQNQRLENSSAVTSVRATVQATQNQQQHSAQTPSPKVQQNAQAVSAAAPAAAQPQAVAWLSNLFAQAPQAQTAHSVSSREAAEAIEAIVNTGAQSLGSFGQVDNSALTSSPLTSSHSTAAQQDDAQQARQHTTQGTSEDKDEDKNDDKRKRKPRKTRSSKPRQRKDQRDDSHRVADSSSADNGTNGTNDSKNTGKTDSQDDSQHKRDDNKRSNDRQRNNRYDNKRQDSGATDTNGQDSSDADEHTRNKRKPHSKRPSRGTLERGETLDSTAKQGETQTTADSSKAKASTRSQQDPNEVTLQVNESPVKLKSPEVVHLSLDDSKSENQPTTAKQAEVSTDEAANKTPSDTQDDNSGARSPTDDKTSSAEQPVSTTATKDQKEDASATAKSAPMSTTSSETQQVSEEQKQETTVTSPTVTDVTSKENASKDSDDKEDKGSSESGKPAVELTHEALFAARYITADKYGQASNDPRVVRHQQQQGVQTNDANKADVVPATAGISTLRGTVGEFIRATLQDAENQLADNGVIGSFIAAMTSYSQPVEAPKQADADVFDFSNYGYQPLSADYLARFSAMTQAVSQYAAPQGKTEVTPTAIGKRASNDPRGQHPDYDTDEPQQQATLTLPEVQPGLKDAQQEVEETTTVAETAEVSTEDQGYEQQNDGKQNASEIDADETQADALTSAEQASDISTESEELLEADQANTSDDQSAQDDEPTKDDSQSAKSKTTIASYKNMIENVAEQLLPQTSMFNLTTPKVQSKVPKARSRKPKAEHKKPTQAEQAEVDSSDSDSGAD
ncbi:Rne/Rng family ribonuclease [Psychrobacter jeotgali]|uniref:Rne/Rng family ribonuclease n=1 Tax=Psychrobacter jeotgali TaxID=179010 RepID=UPI00191A30CD|nr:Rne/Rng family ribonuclease [Psychrobacter jeotgali]